MRVETHQIYEMSKNGENNQKVRKHSKIGGSL